MQGKIYSKTNGQFRGYTSQGGLKFYQGGTRILKWFKHYTCSSDDEFIAGLEEEFGLEGYARWWKLLEAIAKQMDKTDRCFAIT
jgi:hypothetical protein